MTKLSKPIGIIKGEGIGPEIVPIAVECLTEAVKLQNKEPVFIEYTGPAPATEYSETAYQKLKEFYKDIKSKNGCILRSAVYARTVYNLRADFNLTIKPVSFEPIPELLESALLRKELVEKFKVLLIRENAHGLLFSKEKIVQENGQRVMHGSYTYEENKIKELVKFAFEKASQRRKILHLFIKGDVWQKLGPLWFDAAEYFGKKHPDVKFEWDHADTAFADMLLHPQKYDVVIALGIAGDLICDPLATLLYGNHTVVPSANISPDGFTVFQTVHGTAYAIGGQDKANPIGLIRASSLMLESFFGMKKEADLIEKAIRNALAKKFRTIDLYHPQLSHKLVGTKEMGRLIVEEIKNEVSNA